MRKKILIFTLLFTFLGGFLFFTNFVSAEEDFGLSDIAGKADLKKGEDLPTLFGQLLGAALSLVGVIFFLLMIYGGVLWMTARGNAQQTDKALNIIMAAVIGLIIVLGSYALTKFIFTNVQEKPTSAGRGGCFNISPLPITTCVSVDCNNLYKTSTDCAIELCCEWK